MREGVVEWTSLGLAVLVIAGSLVLFAVLPDRPQPTEQFVVTFTEDLRAAAAQSVALQEGVPGELRFVVEQGNLSYLELEIRFVDDVPASDPDRVRVEVLDPEGIVRSPVVDTSNPLPETVPGAVPPAYRAVERQVTVRIPVQDKPGTQVINAANARETEAQAAARIAPDFTGPGQGEWVVRLTLVAGDCPAPELDPQRAAVCRGQATDGTDQANPFEVVQFRSFHWVAGLIRA